MIVNGKPVTMLTLSELALVRDAAIAEIAARTPAPRLTMRNVCMAHGYEDCAACTAEKRQFTRKLR